jgi:hypothetical protein
VPVGGLELGSWSLAAEDGELVAQDEDLEVLGGVAAGEEGKQLDGATQRQVIAVEGVDGLPQRPALG